MRIVKSAAAPYDVDVVVIGCGPAGMAAAVRARWVKSYRTVPCSVAVFESGRVGGLAGWRTCSLTGPGWRYIGDGLVREIRTDFDRYHIPVIPERVTRIAPLPGGMYAVEGGQTTLRCLSVVVATGMRPLTNEADFIGRGMFITYMGYEYFPRLFQRIEAALDGGELVVVGNRKSTHIAPLLAHLSPTWLIDDEVVPALPGRTLRGRLLRVLGEGDAEAGFDAGDAHDPAAPDFERAAAAGVAGVRLATDAGEQTLPCRAVLLDYNAFELTPSFLTDRLSMDRTEGGFVAVNEWCATSTPGVFAAGDITGRYRSTAMALGDGVNAGLGAVKHAWTRKFGAPLSLFAYQATDRPLTATEHEIPPLTSDLVPVPLAPMEALVAPLGQTAARRAVLAGMDGAASIGSLAGALPETEVTAMVEAMLELKLGTVHRRLTTSQPVR